jgi:hypothetical protein
MSFDLKICKKCNKEKSLPEFSISIIKIVNGISKIYYRPICKECRKPLIHASSQKFYYNNREKVLAEKKEYYENNKDIILPKVIKYAEQNKDKKKSYNKAYHKDNREKVQKQQNIYRKQRREQDPEYRLREDVSTLVRRALKTAGGSKKGQSIEKYLPFSIEELRVWIENQFEPWMNWNNQGIYNTQSWDDNDLKTWTWQLDHIIPQTDLPYTSMEDDNFKKCWALTNLRPLSAKQNLLDGVTSIRHNKRQVA